MSVVKVSDVWWRYEGRREYALKGVSVEVEKGEFLAIMGSSGAGKTTLVLTMNGTVPQRIPGEFRGRVEVLGMNTAEHDVTELARRVAIVFEDPEIQFVMSTVEDEVVLALEPLGLSREEMRERLEWSLSLVGLSREFLDRPPLQLSGGEKQRVAIATALARQPEVLILDEPTSDLDPLGKEEVIAAIRRVRDELDITVILVEHESEYVADFADRVIVLSEGRVVMEGEPAQIFRRMDKLKKLGVYPPDVAELSTKLNLGVTTCRLEEALRLVSKLVKGVRTRALRGKGHKPGEVLLECSDVKHIYPDGVVALRGVSLRIHAGELVALVGPNGSGKTTLAKIISGLLRPTEGEVRLLGKPIEEYDRLHLSALIGYVYQNPDHQIFNQSVYDEVAFGLRLRGLPEEEVEKRVRRALRIFGLEGLEEEHPFFLSKGEKRRLALASVYVLDPKILVVDEPTTGQDMRFSETLMQLLKKLSEEGRAVIVITHAVPLASRYVDRMIVLREGRIIGDGGPREILTSPIASEGRLVMPQILRLYRKLGLDPSLAPLTVDEFLSVVEIAL
ncbi:MAG: ABC transporter ATP-binding protein [Thermoprotei archaeon]|nr:MAG: ABC transporter ATP-binding protein [Thermoprotei archaeon]